jgi:hypothetical protein
MKNKKTADGGADDEYDCDSDAKVVIILPGN